MIRLFMTIEKLLPEISCKFGRPVLVEGQNRFCSEGFEELAGERDFSAAFTQDEGQSGLCRSGAVELCVNRGELQRRVVLPASRVLLDDGEGGILSIVSVGDRTGLCALLACALVELSDNGEVSQGSRGLLELLPCAVGWKDDSFKYLGVNKKMREVFPGAGKGTDDYQKPWKDMAFLNRRQDIMALTNSEAVSFRLPLTSRDGRGEAVIYKFTLRNTHGCGAVIVTCLDLEKGEKIDVAALETAQAGIVEKRLVDDSGVVAFRLSGDYEASALYVSDSVRSLGYDRGAFFDGRMSFSQLFHPQDREKVHEKFHSAADSGKTVFFARVRAADGSARHMRCSICRAAGDDAWEAALFDVTRMEEARQALTESTRSIQERLELILGVDSAPFNSEGLLSTYFNIERLQAQQDMLSRVTGLSAVLTDVYGEYLTQLSGESCAACRYVGRRGTDMTFCRGRYMDMMYQASVSGRAVIEPCPVTGLLTAVIPLMIEKNSSAAWVLGQARHCPVNEEEVRLACGGIGVAPGPVIRSLRDMPVVSAEHFDKTVREWEYFADNIGLQCGRASQILVQDETARQLHKKMLRGYEQQHLINRCFTITYESADLTEAMNRIFAEIGGELGFSRVYLIERKASGLFVLSLEWMIKGLAQVPWEHRVFSPAALWRYAYDSNKITVFEGDAMSEGCMAGYFRDTGARSSVQFPIFENGELVGILGLDECQRMRLYFTQERTLLQTLLHMISNIVLRRKAERETNLTQSVMNSVMENIDLIVYATDAESGRIVYANEKYRKLTGGQNVPESALEPYFPDSGGAGFSEVWMNGRCYMTAHSVVPWTGGRIVKIVSAADITANKEKELVVQNLAYRDGLLGIGNRRKFETDLEEVMRGAKDGSGRGALIFIDLDDFKYVNDTYGHESGDRLLIEIADELSGIGRGFCELYRLGGDEFMFIVRENPDEDALEPLVERLWTVFQKSWDIGGGEKAACTASFGVARFPEDAKTAVELLRYADIAMYKAKFDGKNSVAYYRSGLDVGLSRRMKAENRLRESVEGGCRDFVLLYQPILHGKTGRVVGAEALIRWRGEDGRLLLPDTFVDLAESLGLLGEIGRWVFATAMEDLAEFDPMNIHINLTVRQIQGKTVVQDAERALREKGVDPSRLFIEVSEQALMHDVTQGRLEELRKAGIRVVIDRFGTERSVVPALIHAPADCLSVDPAYILNIKNDEFSAAFTESAVALAHSAGFIARAVGVETAEQRTLLTDFDFIQGSLLGEPMLIEDFESWLMRYVTRKTHLRSGGGRR